ncbi:hypothetical protein FRC03_010820 [Tulasnella sp. 419]|nr:hypothetical protein FRC02_000745 [Tulasnella sp. 418]KAG8956470.1 hypothetical protein FRC03_010820 [Tulasnella sp. 419]
MKVLAALTGIVFGLSVSASPLHKRQMPTDSQILQFALTLEHLEAEFYRQGLEKYSQDDFVNGGLPAWARKRFQQIADHEASHVAFLEASLGDVAPAKCQYNFPYDSPRSFAALAMVLEGVGVSAYLGAARFIADKDYAEAAESIMSVESRHAAWISSAIQKQAAWGGAFDTPLNLNQVYSLAAPFFVTCPETNFDLPVRSFPPLSIKTKQYSPGSRIALQFDDSAYQGQELYLALFNGLSTEYVKIEGKKARLPPSLEGTVYAVVTKSPDSVNDDNTIAGVAILYFTS